MAVVAPLPPVVAAELLLFEYQAAVTEAQPVAPSESGVPALLALEDAMLLDVLELLFAADVLLALLAEEPLPVLLAVLAVLAELPPLPPPPHAARMPAASARLMIPACFAATI